MKLCNVIYLSYCDMWRLPRLITVSFLYCQIQRDASFRAGPAGSETRPAPLSEPAVPQVAHRAPGRGEREGSEDPVHISEGKMDDVFTKCLNVLLSMCVLCVCLNLLTAQLMWINLNAPTYIMP